MGAKLKLATVATTMVVLLSTVTATFAQPPGGGFGGRGGGRGGFGMGGGIAGLLRMEEVRTHLNVTEDQAEEVKIYAEDALSGITFSRGGGMTDEQRNELMEKMQEATDKVDAKLAEVLDPDQFDRALGLYAQQQGAAALTNKQIVAVLGLSEETVGKLKAKQEELRGQFSGFPGGRPPRGEGGNRPPRPEGGDRPPRPEGGDRPPRPEGGDRPPRPEGEVPSFNPEEMRARFEQVRKERDDALLALISEEEREKFEKLKGEKFQFPEFGGFGRGNRGDRGGRGGERGEGGDRGERGEGRGGDRPPRNEN